MVGIGSIRTFKRGTSGSWYYGVRYKGKEYCRGGFKTKREAQEAGFHHKNELETLDLNKEMDSIVMKSNADLQDFGTYLHVVGQAIDKQLKQ